MADNLGLGNNPFLGQGNPYLQTNINNTMGDMTRGYNMMTKPNTESAMVGSGSFGNSGLQQMQQKQQSDFTDSMGKTAAGMRQNDYNNQQSMYQWDKGFNQAGDQWNLGFNRSLYNDAVGQNQQNFQNYNSLLNTGAAMNQNDMTNANNVQNTALNYFNNFSGTANGMANGFGGSTNTTSMPGSPLMGALGGWQLGSQFGK